MRSLVLLAVAAVLAAVVWLGVEHSDAQISNRNAISMTKGDVVRQTGRATAVMRKANGATATINCGCDKGQGTCNLTITTTEVLCYAAPPATCTSSCSITSVTTSGISGRGGAIGGAVGPSAPPVGTR